MNIKTQISSQKGNQHYIRGKKLTDLIKDNSFMEVVFLLWRGSLPRRKEIQLFDAILVSCAEHGTSVPSLYVPRVSASVGNSMHTALAAGLLSTGTNHGGAIEPAAKLLVETTDIKTAVTKYLQAQQLLPGFGHRMYKIRDPRAKTLHDKAKQLNFPCAWFDKAYALEEELKKQKGKMVPLNVDGAAAAALLELGFNWRFGQAAFLLARLAGMAAHVVEEQNQHNPYYRL